MWHVPSVASRSDIGGKIGLLDLVQTYGPSTIWKKDTVQVIKAEGSLHQCFVSTEVGNWSHYGHTVEVQHKE